MPGNTDSLSGLFFFGLFIEPFKSQPAFFFQDCFADFPVRFPERFRCTVELEAGVLAVFDGIAVVEPGESDAVGLRQGQHVIPQGGVCHGHLFAISGRAGKRVGNHDERLDRKSVV